jgi:hypothetical protein
MGTLCKPGYEFVPTGAERAARYVNSLLEPLRQQSNEFWDDQRKYLA